MTRRRAFFGWLSARVATARGSQFVRSTAGVGGLAGAELALGLFTAILLARELGATGLGTYSIALATAILVGLPVDFGLPNLVMREIAHSRTDPDSGIVMHFKINAQGMFHFMSLSAPFVVRPGDTVDRGTNNYWFDPETMEPLIDQPGHVRALETLFKL